MMPLFRIALTVFAVAMIVFGFITMISPIPFGFIFILLGFFILTVVAPAFVRWFRRRWRWLDRRMDALEKRLPKWAAKHLRRSDPDPEDEDTDEAVEES